MWWPIGHQEPCNDVGSLSSTEHPWGLTWNSPYIIATPYPTRPFSYSSSPRSASEKHRLIKIKRKYHHLSPVFGFQWLYHISWWFNLYHFTLPTLMYWTTSSWKKRFLCTNWFSFNLASVTSAVTWDLNKPAKIVKNYCISTGCH